MALDPRNIVILKGIVSIAELPAAKTVAADHTAGTLACAAHGFADGDSLMIWAGTGGTVPAGLTAGNSYFVTAEAAGTFKLAATAGGAAVALTSDGTGPIFVQKLAWTDLGEAPKCTWTPKVEKKTHESSRTATPTTDKTVISKTSATVAIDVEEINTFNFALLTGGTAIGNIVTLLDQPARTVALRVNGTNDGQQLLLEVPRITLTPSGGLDFIGSDWAKGSVEGESEAIDGHPWPFGRVTFLPPT